jgi:hypothetical protein
MRFFHSVGLERTSGNRIHPQIELSFTEFKPLMVSARGVACRTYQDLRFPDADEGLPFLATGLKKVAYA